MHMYSGVSSQPRAVQPFDAKITSWLPPAWASHVSKDSVLPLSEVGRHGCSGESLHGCQNGI